MRAVAPALIFACCLPAVPAGAGEYELTGGYLLRGYAEENAMDPVLSFMPDKVVDLLGTDQASLDRECVLLWAYARLAMSPTDDLSLVANLDSGLLSHRLDDPGDGEDRFLVDGLTPDDAAAKLVFLREVWLEWGVGAEHQLVATAGKKRTVIMDGWLYDDHGFRAGIDWDLWSGRGSTLVISAAAVLPQHYFPDADPGLLLATAAVSFGDLFDFVSAGFVRLRDRSNVLVPMVKDALATDLAAADLKLKGIQLKRADLNGDADVSTFWISGQWTADPVVLRGLAALQAGALTARWTPQEDKSKVKQQELDQNGTLLFGEGEISLADWLRFTPFVIRVSGASPKDAAKMHELGEFLTLVPSAQHLPVFFGSAADFLAGRDYHLLGIGGAGVQAVGAALEWEVAALSVSHEAALLGPHRPDDDAFSFDYGWETDHVAVWKISGGLDLRLELGALFPGSYFTADKPMMRGIAGVEGTW